MIKYYNSICSNTSNNALKEVWAKLIKINNKIVNKTIYNKTIYNKTIYNETIYNKTIYNETIYNKTIYNKTIYNKTIYIIKLYIIKPYIIKLYIMKLYIIKLYIIKPWYKKDYTTGYMYIYKKTVVKNRFNYSIHVEREPRFGIKILHILHLHQLVSIILFLLWILEVYLKILCEKGLVAIFEDPCVRGSQSHKWLFECFLFWK